MFDFLSKCWYGAVLWGQTPKLVRSSRMLTGQVKHTAVSRPATASTQATDKYSPAAGCIGIQESLTLWLDTPFTSKNKALRVLPSMLDVQLPFPLEDCCYCFVHFQRKTANTISVLAVAARRAAVQQCLDSYRSFGIDPMVIDHEGLALWQQSGAEKPVQPDMTRIVVNLEPDHISFALGSGNLFLNSHSLQMPGGAGAAITPEETHRRMHRILCAELHPGQPVEWIFCGALARQAEFINALHRLLNVEWPGAAMVLESPDTFLPRALATRALGSGRFLCNLRRQELTHPAVQAVRRRHSAHAGILLLLTGILLCLFNLAWDTIGSFKFNNAKREIGRLTGELAPGRAVPYGQEAAEVRQVVQKRLTEFEPLLNVFAQPLSIRLAEIINSGRKADLNYTRLELSRGKLSIQGTTEDWNNCELLTKRLDAMGCKVEIERGDAEDDNLVHFTVKGISKP